jgi:uncharacterized membrane protein YoaK (UPF0700 family)
MPKKAINALANIGLFVFFAGIFAGAIQSLGAFIFGDHAALVLWGWIAIAAVILGLMCRSFYKRWESAEFFMNDPRFR